MNIDSEYNNEMKPVTDKISIDDFVSNETNAGLEPKPRSKRKIYREIERAQKKLDKKNKKKAMKK